LPPARSPPSSPAPCTAPPRSRGTPSLPCFSSFFYNETAPTETSTLSLHDALPIYELLESERPRRPPTQHVPVGLRGPQLIGLDRSEEHTSELQSLTNLVCRLLLEKKKKITSSSTHGTSPHTHSAPGPVPPTRAPRH